MADFSEEDRQACIEGLKRRLDTDALRSVVPRDLERLVTKVERARNAQYDPRIADAQLAGLLLDLHGPDLFRSRAVRAKVIESATDEELQLLYNYHQSVPARGRRSAEKSVVEKNWHAGKSWARFFLTTLGLPPVLAGTLGESAGPDYEDIEPWIPLPPLHGFQVNLVQDVLGVLNGPAQANRAILTLPTGAGKTRTAVEAIVEAICQAQFSGRFVLWIAQSDELCEQAVGAVREVWTDRSVRSIHDPRGQRGRQLRVFRLWGTRPVPDPSDSGIIVASIQKLSSLCSRNDPVFLGLLQGVGPVVVDEAHHAIAPTYSAVFNALGLSGKEKSARAMLGLTATPYRGSDSETSRLIGRFYRKLLSPGWTDPMAKLRSEGILAKMTTSLIETKQTFHLNEKELKHVRTFHDLPDSTLLRIGNNRDRNLLILQQLLELPDDPKNWGTLFFGCSVDHACAIALLLRRTGRSASVVTGETPRSLRRRRIDKFRQGELQFLCNYGVLTTGFDAPKVRVVAIARPTASVLLYEQMVGRGMRGPKNGGKEECLVIDMVDVIPRFGEGMSYQRYAAFWKHHPNITDLLK
jgi:DNA repair protein RadD